MPASIPSLTVHQAFFRPLDGLAAHSPAARNCPELSDETYLHCGIQRVLHESPSGRAFLQEHAPVLSDSITHSNYFANLHSPRRLALLTDIDTRVREQAHRQQHDRLAGLPGLSRYECFAADGHWHQAATHDPRHDGTKMAVGHFYSLNLHTHTLHHLAAAEGLHEHDMHALKRITPRGLRHDVPRGRRVLLVYDRAGIDLAYWKRCRHECAIYHLSRKKENIHAQWQQLLDWDRADARNAGVREDVHIRTAGGHELRMICYVEPVTDQCYEFLTNVMDLAPGVLVELYRRRWEIEKVFDELKNKLGQGKAWASGLEARTIQARFLTLTHNLLLLYERELEQRHQVLNAAENQRRQRRTEAMQRHCQQARRALSSLVTQARGATQRSVKFIRWLRHALRQHLAETTAVPRLNALYALL